MRSLFVLSLALSSWACAPAGPPRAEPPSGAVARVILISCDTLRADRLGAYGYGRNVSPNLDAFAREGVVFDEAYASAPMTQPAVSSLLTGRLPLEVGAVPGNMRRMPSEVVTVAERLRDAGYETAAIVANWVLRRSREDPGAGVGQGFDYYDASMIVRKGAVAEKKAARTTDDALVWLDRRASDRFFLWVHYQDPHGPYSPPPPFGRLYQGPRDRAEPVPLGTTKLGLRQIPGYQRHGDLQDPDVYRDLYDAEIRYFDRELGRLLSALRAEGLLEDALVVFTADHGEALGEHDYWFCHGESVYREIVRVPLMVRWPRGFVPDGYPAPGADGFRRFAPLASHLDVVPTVLAAAALEPGELLGRSLLDEPPPAQRILPQDLSPSEQRPRWWSASDGRYRLIWNEDDDARRLFDVRADPFEEDDLAAELPDVVARLADGHAQIVSAAEPAVESGDEPEISDEDREALEALGYLDAASEE